MKSTPVRQLIFHKKSRGTLLFPDSTKLLTKPTWAKPSNQMNQWALFQIYWLCFLYNVTAHQSIVLTILDKS